MNRFNFLIIGAAIVLPFSQAPAQESSVLRQGQRKLSYIGTVTFKVEKGATMYAWTGGPGNRQSAKVAHSRNGRVTFSGFKPSDGIVYVQGEHDQFPNPPVMEFLWELPQKAKIGFMNNDEPGVKIRTPTEVDQAYASAARTSYDYSCECRCVCECLPSGVCYEVLRCVPVKYRSGTTNEFYPTSPSYYSQWSASY